MSDTLETRRGGAMDDEDVLRFFEQADLTQCLVTHAQAQGILRMRQRGEESGKRKRRRDAGQKRGPMEPDIADQDRKLFEDTLR